MIDGNKTKIIAIEGIDGSGKTVQWEMLANKLRDENKIVDCMSFPNYEGFFGSRCGDMLRGDEIRSDQVDSKSLCLWYALDRWDTFKNYRAGESDYLLINRFTLSNAVYQSIREIDFGMPDNWEWVRRLEHEELGLPVPDLYLLMDVDPDCAQKNVDQKQDRKYVTGRDVYESQHGLLKRARQRYLDIADRENNVARINCMDESSRNLRPKEEIFADVMAILTKRGLL